VSPQGTFLIVRHGPGRGRLQPYIQQCFDTLLERDGVLRDGLAFHATGGTAPDLDGTRGILFLLADPLEELYPDCYAEAVSIARDAERRGIRLYNPPQVLAEHSKGRTAALLADAGIPCPRARPYRDRTELVRLLEDAEYPAILRADTDHAQIDARVLRDSGALADPASGPVPAPGVLSPLVDVRSGRKATGRPDPFRRWVHRYRAFVFGDICMPGHLHFSGSWVVGGHNVIWDLVDSRSRWVRDRLGAGRLNGLAQRLIRTDPWYRAGRAADIRFRREGPPDPELFVRAARALGYDFVAFDFGRLPDGRPIIFEANPYPFINSMPGGILWRERELDRYTERMYGAIGRYLHSRI